MKSTVTLFEHGVTTGFGLKDRDLVALERLHHSLGVEILRPVTRRGAWELQATQHVGVVRLGRRTIQILPKIYRSSEHAKEKQRALEATRSLLQLLEYAGNLQVR